MNINREIYNKHYSDKNLRLSPKTDYDKRIIQLRFSYIKEFGFGKDVLDLCCGSGSYLIPVLDQVKTAVGIDFSSNMLNEFRKNLAGNLPPNLHLIEADAMSLPIADKTFDFVFSYTSLYHVPDIRQAVQEVSRVLRHGGRAALELGNQQSLTTILNNYMHKRYSWAKIFPIPYRHMLRYLKGSGLTVENEHSFQILPMFGAPKKLFYLYPLLNSHWKKVLGIQIGDKMLDEWISGSGLLRHFSFRHFFLVKKQ